MHMLKLTKIDRVNRDHYSDSDDPTEAGGGVTENVDTSPVAINAERIRCFYPRRDAKPGTRITFSDGGGFAVTEPYDVVLAMFTTH